MTTRLSIDPADVPETEWAARVCPVLQEAKSAGEVVDLVTRTETLTPAEAANRLGLDRSTVSRKIKAGAIATTKVGAHHRIPRSEFERYRDSIAPEPLFSYGTFAQIIAGGQDWHFAARQLRELVLRSRRTTAVDSLDAIHKDPGPTGIRGWDAIIGGVAAMTGRGRVSDPGLLDWCFEKQRYATDCIFDPFRTPAKYFWTDYLRTPVELRVRNVVFPAGNLEGV